MANASEWTSMLTGNGWIDGEGNLVAQTDATLKITLPDGRSFTIRGGKTSPPIRIVGEFMQVTESNIDTAGRGRITAIPLSSLLSIEALA